VVISLEDVPVKERDFS